MARIITKPDEFTNEAVFSFVDEGHSMYDPSTGQSINIGLAASELSDSINTLCSDGVEFARIERLCAAIQQMLSTVEHAAYTAGAVAQRDGRARVQTRIIDGSELWNSTATEEETEDDFNA